MHNPSRLLGHPESSPFMQDPYEDFNEYSSEDEEDEVDEIDLGPNANSNPGFASTLFHTTRVAYISNDETTYNVQERRVERRSLFLSSRSRGEGEDGEWYEHFAQMMYEHAPLAPPAPRIRPVTLPDIENEPATDNQSLIDLEDADSAGVNSLRFYVGELTRSYRSSPHNGGRTAKVTNYTEKETSQHGHEWLVVQGSQAQDGTMADRHGINDSLHIAHVGALLKRFGRRAE